MQPLGTANQPPSCTPQQFGMSNQNPPFLLTQPRPPQPPTNYPMPQSQPRTMFQQQPQQQTLPQTPRYLTDFVQLQYSLLDLPIRNPMKYRDHNSAYRKVSETDKLVMKLTSVHKFTTRLAHQGEQGPMSNLAMFFANLINQRKKSLLQNPSALCAFRCAICKHSQRYQEGSTSFNVMDDTAFCSEAICYSIALRRKHLCEACPMISDEVRQKLKVPVSDSQKRTDARHLMSYIMLWQDNALPLFQTTKVPLIRITTPTPTSATIATRPHVPPSTVAVATTPFSPTFAMTDPIDWIRPFLC